ncbi:isocitrate lyase/PEP mutase family protein [Mycolicibacterium smegmatis]|uniref:isocitrate lyase/PEP mutase family protein n=1 Tax=Mycolicibacterium smegmatis TaxID=1772 RepID=UPI0005D9E825|nr:isocitrate lyase/PEP mutase family protein [Mycolicibacterium smegmatis]MDF1903385.1 isocitrate lyase/PEP mutase family protein [Mycolicibacterium smegmatis]MDF1909884.1 isocitrate lyase/PEP mutase family protein [Mycolicibacterium smegmatis]MDF1921825.1 isocitrate lyase/PEP mutase family protein [Mycolicibacterium smegmatis]MDF1928272.1 isocitrate lyase/PEP mutase family protein [Mycolicibacterium smegmatis]UAK56057.1 isocitrate lyase/PEP mutase family protein [Mycolicibacterium smegmatis]
MDIHSLRSTFAERLHAGGNIVAPGAYDALSAQIIARSGFEAVFIGSFGIAASAYGLPDVGLLSLDQLTEHTRNTARAVDIPVIADAEGGFFEPANMWRTVRGFEDAGVCAIHIEDNLGGKHSAEPAGLLSPEAMSARIRAAVDAKTDPAFQIIARTDARWVYGDVGETVRRLRAYIDAGADMVFAPGISAAELAAVRADLARPVMVLADLPTRAGEALPEDSVDDFVAAGANLIVLFYLTLGAAALGVRRVLEDFTEHRDVRKLDGLFESQHAFEAAMGYDTYEARVARYGGR